MHIPYSGKFSLVQNFAELLVNPLEEIFVVLFFASSLCGDHTHMYMDVVVPVLRQLSSGIRERVQRYSRKVSPC